MDQSRGWDPTAGGLEIAFRLPLQGWPRALFQTDYGYRGGRLMVDGSRVLWAASRQELEEGMECAVGGEPVRLQLIPREGGEPILRVFAGDKEAEREDKIWAKPSRSAWIHAFIALFGSAAGFASSYAYLLKAAELHDDWARKMGVHTAGWHLLLTFMLFPASVWGQRMGIRSVQVVSFVFFCIHAGIAMANSDVNTVGIAFFNALSGVLFAASTVYGQRAYRDMDPVAALVEGRT